MKNKQYKYTYGRPVATSVFLVAYSLGWLGICIFFTLVSGGGCNLAWMMIFLIMWWLATTAALAVASIVILWRYTRRIIYLRKHQTKVPRSYILMLVLLPVALSALFWIAPIAMLISPLAADTKMNTIQEFRQAAQGCEIESVGTYYNNTFHRAEDANAYIEVGTDRSTLHYSLNQKDELHQIYQEYAGLCAGRIAEREREYVELMGEYYFSTAYYNIDWSNEIEKYNTSC